MSEILPLTLHNYFRSSTSIRVRAALNLKGLDYHYVAYNLRSGEEASAAFLAKNPAGLVPALELADGTVLTQSLAIIEWLDEVQPEPALLPADPIARARVRSLAYMIACEIHPLNNLRVLQFIRQYGLDDAGVKAWFQHWVQMTFMPLEQSLASSTQTGRFCHGDSPSMADICLYAQMWNNKRFQVDTTPYPIIERIFAALETIPAFQQASPPQQPDAVS